MRARILAAALLVASVALAARKPLVVSASIQSTDTIANTATETAFGTALGVDATTPNDLRYGQTYRVTAYGVMSTLASAQGTLTLKVRHRQANGASSTFVLGTTGAFTPPASLSSAPWTLNGFITYNSTGSSGTAVFVGWLEIQNASNTAFVVGIVPSGMSSGGTTGWTTSVNTLAAGNYYEVTATWQTASTSNSITAWLAIERVA